jgi:hypothetical protein
MERVVEHRSTTSPADVEQFGVHGETGVEFTLDASRTTDPDVGTCAEEFVRATVDELLALFYPAMEEALGNAWDAAAAATQQARALDALFSPLEVGTYEPFDHDLDLAFTRLATLERSSWTQPPPNDVPPHDGLVGVLRTAATLRPGFELVPPPATWVYSPPLDPVVDPDPTDSQPGVASTDGNDLFGQPFDLAFGITTGMLNQVLRERSATEWMRFEWKPTWEGLGVSPPAGANPGDPATLDGTVLASALDPAFSTLGTSTLTVVAQPTLLPFTWIPPDPFRLPLTAPQFVWGRVPFTYHLSQFLIDVYSSDPANSHPIQLAIDFYDDDFGFGTTGPSLLTPALGNAVWTTTALRWIVPDCDLAAMTRPSSRAPTCGGLAAQALGDVFVPILEDGLLGMLGDVPAPLRFDAAGAGETRRFTRRDVFVGGQRVIFYGGLE